MEQNHLDIDYEIIKLYTLIFSLKIVNLMNLMFEYL